MLHKPKQNSKVSINNNDRVKQNNRVWWSPIFSWMKGKHFFDKQRGMGKNAIIGKAPISGTAKIIDQLQNIGEKLLYPLSVLFISLLPLYIGEIITDKAARVFGLYINYLHIRITLQAVIAATVCWAYVAATKQKITPKTAKMIIGALLLVSISTVSAFVLGAKIGTFGPIFALTSGYYLLCLILQVAALYIAISTVLSHKEKSWLLLFGLQCSIGVQGFFALAQALAKKPFFPEYFSWIGQPITFTSFSQIGAMDFSRIYGTTPHPNILAAIMALFLVLVLAIEMKPLQKYALSIVIITIIGGTLSKAAILVSVGVLVFYLFRKETTKSKHPLFLLSIAVSAVFMGLLPYIATYFETYAFLTTRAQIQQLYVELLTLNPLYLVFGTGFKTSIPALYYDLKQMTTNAIFQSQLLVEPPHNILLLMTVELGLPITFTLLKTVHFLIERLAVPNSEQWLRNSLILMLLIFGTVDHFLLY